MSVGTTTIRFGLTRYGPSAPSACQFGKNELRIRIGVPGSDTSKLTESPSSRTFDTVTSGTGRQAGSVSSGATRAHSDGPDVASGTSQREGSWYQITAGPAVLAPTSWPGAGAERSFAYTQPSMWSSVSVSTTGSQRNGVTRSASATSNTTHWCWTPSEVGAGVIEVSSVSRSSARAAAIAASEVAR